MYICIFIEVNSGVTNLILNILSLVELTESYTIPWYIGFAMNSKPKGAYMDPIWDF